MNQADRLNEHDTCFTTTDVHNPTKNGSHRLTPSPTHPLSLIEMPNWEYPSSPTIAAVSPGIEPQTIMGISDTELSGCEQVAY